MSNTIILALLDDVGHTGGSLALKYKVNRSLVYASISGKGSRKMRVSICHVLGKPPSNLWPDNSRKSLLIDDDQYMNPSQYLDANK